MIYSLSLVLLVVAALSGVQAQGHLTGKASQMIVQSGYYYPNAVQQLLAKAKSLNISIDDLVGGEEGLMCWKGSYGRGVGRPIHTCPPDTEQSGLLCYPKCKAGYYGVGPVCWESCKPGYQDDGAFCAKHARIISADNSACPWYDVCGLTFSRGCSKCPTDEPWHNDGCTCRIDPHIYAKGSYGRTAGVPLGCGPNEQYDAGLCYDPCRETYNGVGPVCWGQCSPKAPADFGALCCETGTACSDKVKDMARGVFAAVAAAVLGGDSVEAVIEDIKKALEAVLGFVLPLCSILQPRASA